MESDMPWEQRGEWRRPQVVVEGGDEAPAILLTAMERQLGLMLVGQVMEVATRDPGAGQVIAAWCRSTGNRLLQAITCGDNIEIWIRKEEQ